MYRFDSDKHVHLLNEQPLFGTSTVCKEVMPPFLAKWGATCAIDYLKEHGRDVDLDDLRGTVVTRSQFETAVFAYTKVRDKAAEKGTDMHAELEKYVKACISLGGAPVHLSEGEDWTKQTIDFSHWAMEKVEKFILSETNVYSEKLWTGGIIDVLAVLKDIGLSVLDFKSSKEAYFNQVAQAGGYASQFEENGAMTAEGSPVFPHEPIKSLVIVPFGSPRLHPEIFTNVEGFKSVFQNLVEIYKMQQAFKNK